MYPITLKDRQFVPSTSKRGGCIPSHPYSGPVFQKSLSRRECSTCLRGLVAIPTSRSKRSPFYYRGLRCRRSFVLGMMNKRCRCLVVSQAISGRPKARRRFRELRRNARYYNFRLLEAFQKSDVRKSIKRSMKMQMTPGRHPRWRVGSIEIGGLADDAPYVKQGKEAPTSKTKGCHRPLGCAPRPRGFPCPLAPAHCLGASRRGSGWGWVHT